MAPLTPAMGQSAATTNEAPRPTVLRMEPGNSLGASKPTASDRPKVVAVPAKGAAGPSRPPPANDYEFCNQTSYVLSISVGLRMGSMVFTRGWWPLNAGECKVFIKGPLTSSVYFTHARSSFAHAGAIRVWGGKHKLCTGRGNFQATTSEDQPCGPGHNHQEFARVDTGGKPGWRTTLTESAQIRTLEQARLAGLQRLLRDLGLFDGAIDGVPGPKYTEALGQARTALGAGGDAAALQSRLLAEATRLQQAAGLTLCNRSQEILYTAYGRESEGRKRSRGWYVLLPEQCEKVLKDALTEPFIYAFATLDNAPPNAPTGDNWRGTSVFCTREGEFDLDDAGNCGGKGYESSGFVQIPTEGRPGVVFEFRAPAAPPTEN